MSQVSEKTSFSDSESGVAHEKRPFSATPGKKNALLARAQENPILEPTSRWWESTAVLNPAVVEDEQGVIHILYRAIGRDGISRLGHATTRDGVTIEERSREPFFDLDSADEYDDLGIEDPRIVFLDGAYYMTYTALSAYKIGKYAKKIMHSWGETPPSRARVALALTADFRSFTRHGVILPEMDNKDAVLFPEQVGGKYVILHRLPPDIWISFSPDLRDWHGHRSVLRTRPASWDERRLGAGPPPVRIDGHWLLLYHGSDHHNVYRAGFAVLDGNDPSSVLGRSEHAALEPVEEYEKTGVVPRVVFPTGLVKRGDTLLVYYGAADRVVALARGSIREILSSLR